MVIKVGINGYGCIGCCMLCVIYELGLENEFEIVVINVFGDFQINVYLIKYDMMYGCFCILVEIDGENIIIINGKCIFFYLIKNLKDISWVDYGVDVLFECIGFYIFKVKVKVLFDQGVKCVLIFVLGGDDVDVIIVYGVNYDLLIQEMIVVFNVFCMINCLVLVVKVLQDNIGIKKGLMMIIYVYINDQVLVDVCYKDLCCVCVGVQNIILIKIGVVKVVGFVLLLLKGWVDGFVLCVLIINVLLVDLIFMVECLIIKEEINELMMVVLKGVLKGVLVVNNDLLVFFDFNYDLVFLIFDVMQICVMDGNLVKVLVWYDNEWGYFCCMFDVVCVWMNVK